MQRVLTIAINTFCVISLLAIADCRGDNLVAPNAKVERLQDGFKFLEGPAADVDGNLVFADPPLGKLYRWSTDGQLKTLRENTNMANGHYFDKDGTLIACETLGRRIISIAPDMTVSTVADTFDGQRFNWTRGDTFAVPIWSMHEHAAENEDAVLFSLTDDPLIRALGHQRTEALTGNNGFQKEESVFATEP